MDQKSFLLKYVRNIFGPRFLVHLPPLLNWMHGLWSMVCGPHTAAAHSAPLPVEGWPRAGESDPKPIQSSPAGSKKAQKRLELRDEVAQCSQELPKAAQNNPLQQPMEVVTAPPGPWPLFSCKGKAAQSRPRHPKAAQNSAQQQPMKVATEPPGPWPLLCCQAKAAQSRHEVLRSCTHIYEDMKANLIYLWSLRLSRARAKRNIHFKYVFIDFSKSIQGGLTISEPQTLGPEPPPGH